MDVNTILLILIILLFALVTGMLFWIYQLRRDAARWHRESEEAARAAGRESEERMRRLLTDRAERDAERLEEMDKKINYLTLGTEQRLDGLRNSLTRQVDSLNQGVSQRLEQVSRGFGEMQSLAQGVGDLKKVLSNVKTRGNLGEVRLGAILDDILAPGQYEQNVNTKGTGREFVEYAVKLPGENGRSVYLPIDSKFPADSYIHLTDAYDSGDPNGIARAKRQLQQAVRSEAADIRDKYVAPPRTTDFGILFLPSEGLFAEVVRLGMIEELNTKYKVNIAGPTTMAALLNSLQTGFRTLAIQERTSEVWETLSAVRTEFEKYETVLRRAQENVSRAGTNLDELLGVRTRVMKKKLDRAAGLPGDDEEEEEQES